MTVCDICSSSGVGTVISSKDIKQAVFKQGFNPLSLGLINDPFAKMNEAIWYEGWKTTIVAQDTSDWNICPNCMSKLKPYLKGKPKPTGVKSALVSLDPLKEVVDKATLGLKDNKNKKWWQFWK